MCIPSRAALNLKMIRFVCTIAGFPLRQDRYFGNICCEVNGSVSDWIERAFAIDVIDGDYFGTENPCRKASSLQRTIGMWSLTWIGLQIKRCRYERICLVHGALWLHDLR